MGSIHPKWMTTDDLADLFRATQKGDAFTRKVDVTTGEGSTLARHLDALRAYDQARYFHARKSDERRRE
jgi:hypothetical protein